MSTNHNAGVRWIQKTLLALFFAALLLPALTWDASDGILQTEQRRRAPLPDWPRNRQAIRRWPALFERYVHDRLGARPLAAAAYGRALYFGLHTSPSENVLRGKAGWLFYDPLYDPQLRHDLVSDARGSRPLMEKDADALAEIVLQRERVVAGWGGRYLFVVAPDKSTIYPEYLPDAYAPIPGGDSPRRQLARRLKTFPEGPFLDLEPALLRAKAEASRRGEFLYYRTDTHWNSQGAMVGMEEILQRLRLAYPDLRVPKPADFGAPVRSEISSTDLTRMMGMPQAFLEPNILMTLKPDIEIPAFQRDLYVLVYRDSYFNAIDKPWKQFIPKTFVKEMYATFSDRDFARKKPALVIDLVVERRLREADGR